MGKNSDSPLYSETWKSKKFLDGKNRKTKRPHAFKDYASSYNVEILNSFNPELQLKDTKSPIKNKPIDLFSELKGFKYVATLVLEFQKIESGDKTKYDTFYLNSKAETINKSDIWINLYIYTAIVSNIQKSLGKGSDWFILRS